HIDSAYSGNRVLVTEQAGKQRLQETNALGQLTSIWEIRAADGATETVTFPGTSVSAGYRTKYYYDALSNLTGVTQQVGTGGYAQSRSFAYDPLVRLSSATNPESGTMVYQYDNNGNLTTRTDARSIATSISYDAINRPTLKTYSDSTPQVNYFYDNQTLPSGAPSFTRGASAGRLVAATYGGGSEGTYYAYDSLGRTTLEYQRTGAVSYLIQASYNRAGAMTGETSPSGHTAS